MIPSPTNHVITYLLPSLAVRSVTHSNARKFEIFKFTRLTVSTQNKVSIDHTSEEKNVWSHHNAHSSHKTRVLQSRHYDRPGDGDHDQRDRQRRWIRARRPTEARKRSSSARIDFSPISCVSPTKSVCISVMIRAYQSPLHSFRTVFPMPQTHVSNTWGEFGSHLRTKYLLSGLSTLCRARDAVTHERWHTHVCFLRLYKEQ